MSALRGFIAGTIAVSTAEVLLTAPGVADRIGSAGTLLTDVIDRVVNPDVVAVGKNNFTPAPPLTFDQTNPSGAAGAPDGKKNAQGGVGSTPYGPPVPSNKPRTKVLHSTKAKPPRTYKT